METFHIASQTPIDTYRKKHDKKRAATHSHESRLAYLSSLVRKPRAYSILFDCHICNNQVVTSHHETAICNKVIDGRLRESERNSSGIDIVTDVKLVVSRLIDSVHQSAPIITMTEGETAPSTFVDLLYSEIESLSSFDRGPVIATPCEVLIASPTCVAERA